MKAINLRILLAAIGGFLFAEAVMFTADKLYFLALPLMGISIFLIREARHTDTIFDTIFEFLEKK